MYSRFFFRFLLVSDRYARSVWKNDSPKLGMKMYPANFCLFVQLQFNETGRFPIITTRTLSMMSFRLEMLCVSLPSSNPIRVCPWSGIITYISCEVYHPARQLAKYNSDLKFYIKNQQDPRVSRCKPETRHHCFSYVDELNCKIKNNFH